VARLLHISDTHIVAREDDDPVPHNLAAAVHRMSGRTTTEALDIVLDYVADEGFTPDVLVHTGDVVDTPDPAAYAVAARLLEQVDAPALVTAGNHDDSALLADAFGGAQTTEIGGWTVMLLDSRVEGTESGAIGAAALAWLDDALAATGAHVLIGLHHPPLSGCGDPRCQLQDGYQLLTVLDRYPNVRGVLSGHLHWADEIERGGVRYLLGPSTCIQLKHRHPLPTNNPDPTFFGARLLELHGDGRITSELVWV
jgi:Icc protein